jgi:hypothetical protein
MEVRHASVPGRKRGSETEFFYVRMQFRNNTDYTHIVQEIEYQDGNVLVECFQTDTTVFDHHSAWGDSDHKRVRRMRVYGANVTGEVSWFGFAHLHQNRDGTLVTTVGPSFNPSYWRYAPHWMFHGRIVEDDRDNSSYWTLDYDPERGTLVVTLGS